MTNNTVLRWLTITDDMHGSVIGGHRYLAVRSPRGWSVSYKMTGGKELPYFLADSLEKPLETMEAAIAAATEHYHTIKRSMS